MAVGNSTAPIGAMGTVASPSTEEDPAQHKHSQCLPKRNLMPAEQWRQQPIPQLPNYFATEGDEPQKCQTRQRSQPNPLPFLSHMQFLTLS